MNEESHATDHQSRDELRQRANDGAHLVVVINIPLAKLSEKTVASLDEGSATTVASV